MTLNLLAIRATKGEIKRRAGMETIRDQLEKRRWIWPGPVLRTDNPRAAIIRITEDKRKRGRPRKTLRRTFESDFKARGIRIWT